MTETGSQIQQTLEEKIMETALSLFTTNGIKAVSMDDISKKIGISKRTLYENFSGKDELLVRCMTHHHKVSIEKMKACLKPDASLIDIMLDFITCTIKTTNMINPQFFQDLSMSNFVAANDINQEYRMVNQQKLVEMLEASKRDGIIREDVDTEMTSQLLTQHNHGDFSRMISSGKWHIQDLIKGTVIPFIRGLCTAKGIEMIDRRMAEVENMQNDKA